MSVPISRRKFIYASSLLMGATALSQSKILGANETIRIAIVGMGWWGGTIVPRFANLDNVRVVALCDVDSERLEGAAKEAEEHIGKVDLEVDYRRLLDRNDIDAVVLTTPNHWHALQTVWACQAGKDVYVEKPCAHSIWEGRQMVKAARRYNRVVQVGFQTSSVESLPELRDWLKEGHIGAITGIHAHWYGTWNRGSIGRREEPLRPPASVDYDLWLGPAADEPIYRDEFHYDWHWMWNTGNGDIGNVGSHAIDIARYLLGNPAPDGEVISFGTRCEWDDVGDTPNLHTVAYRLAGVPVTLGINNFPWSSNPDRPQPWRAPMDFKGLRNGQVVFCEGGYFAGHGRGRVFDNEGNVIKQFRGGDNHHKNFIDAVRSRKIEDLSCDIERGHESCTLPLIGTIAHRTGQTRKPVEIAAALEDHPLMSEVFNRYQSQAEHLGLDLKKHPWVLSDSLRFDSESERFIGEDAETEAANALLKRDSYREPFGFPAV